MKDSYLSTSKTEKRAARKIGEMVDESPLLESYFGENDKTLFTDGHIEILGDAAKPKKTFAGRVNVQIKGRKVKNAANRATYSISVNDLKAFQKLDGILYFVVYFDSRSGKAYPKYSLLKPFVLGKILNKAKPTQNKISVPLKRLPADVEKLYSIVKLSYVARQERIIESDSDYLFENLESFTVHSIEPLDPSNRVRFRSSEMDYAVSIRTKDGIEQFVDIELELTPSEMEYHPSNLDISSGGTTFQSVMRRRKEDGCIELQLSEGLTLIPPQPENDLSGSAMISYQNNLKMRLKDLEFFLALLDTNEFAVNGQSIGVKFESHGALSEFRSEANQLRGWVDIARHFKVDPELISLDHITENQAWQLDEISRALSSKGVTEQKFREVGLVMQPFGQWQLALQLEAHLDNEGTKIRGITDPGFDFAVRSDSGEPSFRRITPYDLFEEDQWPEVLNLRLDRIVDEYARLRDDGSTDVDFLANRTVLRLIRAADVQPIRKTEFLNASAKLNDWLLRNDPASPTNLLNQWQILFRQGKLSSSHRDEIRSLKYQTPNDDQTVNHEILLGCALLLGDIEDAEFLLNRFSKEGRKRVLDWPISKLFLSIESS